MRPHDEITGPGGYASTSEEATASSATTNWAAEEHSSGDRAWWVQTEDDDDDDCAEGAREAQPQEDAPDAEEGTEKDGGQR